MPGRDENSLADVERRTDPLVPLSINDGDERDGSCRAHIGFLERALCSHQ